MLMIDGLFGLSLNLFLVNLANYTLGICTEHNSYEDVPWINRLVEFTRKVIEDGRVRLVGICFGHQIVGRALGAKVGLSSKGWEIAVCNMDLTEQGKKLFGKDKLVSS